MMSGRVNPNAPPCGRKRQGGLSLEGSNGRAGIGPSQVSALKVGGNLFERKKTPDEQANETTFAFWSQAQIRYVCHPTPESTHRDANDMQDFVFICIPGVSIAIFSSRLSSFPSAYVSSQCSTRDL